MTDLLKEIKDFSLFLQMIFMVMLYTGFIVMLFVVLIRTLFQAYLYRNVAGQAEMFGGKQ